MIDDEKNGHDPERERLLAVYRGWKRSFDQKLLPHALRSADFWRLSPSSQVSTIIGLILPVDEALWSFTSFNPLHLIAPRSFAIVALVITPVYLFNLALLPRALARGIGDIDKYRLWLAAAGALICGLPFVGWRIITPIRCWIDQRKPPWALRRTLSSGELQLCRPPKGPLIRSLPGLESSFNIIRAYAIVNCIALLVVSLWLARRVSETRSAFQVAAVLSAVLHILSFAGAIPFLRDRLVRSSVSRSQYALSATLSLLILIPVPYLSLLGAAALHYLDPVSRRWDTILLGALRRRKEAARLPIWLKLEDSLRRGWKKRPWPQRMWRVPEPVNLSSEAPGIELRVFTFYNFSTFAVALDAACLALVLAWLANHNPNWLHALEQVYRALIFMSITLWSLTLCIAAVHNLLGWLHLSVRLLHQLDRVPYTRYLARTQFSFFAGLYVGLRANQIDPADLGPALAQVCFLLVLFKAFFFLVVKDALPKVPWRRQQSFDEPQVILTMVLAVLGVLWVNLDTIAKIPIFWLFHYPVRVFLFGYLLLPWLIRPFSWRAIFRPTFPLRLRAEIAILVSTLLPFGGLAIPLCLYIRDQRWAEASSIWAKSHPTGELASQEPPEPSLADLQLERTF